MDNLKKIIAWANDKASIRALILSGSLAGMGRKDKFSDYDIAVYGNNFDFIQDDQWLLEISNYLVCIHEKFEFLGHTIPTRLTIFDIDFKVDFSFHPLSLLVDMIENKNLPDDYTIGYQILLDKDGLAIHMQKPAYTGFKLIKPDEDAFKKNTDEFWFEVYHTAKYLYRDDLWAAKFRDWSAKKWMREMLQWEHACKLNWDFSPKNDGKNMRDWVDQKKWESLFLCFGSFDKKNSLEALENTIELYRTAATGVAKHLGYVYGQKSDAAISSFVKSLSS